MKHFNQIYFNKSRNQKNLIRNTRLNDFSSVSSYNGITDSTLNQNYKQLAIKQMHMQLDPKILGLIAKMNEEKTFEMLKSQYDEDKRKLLAKTMKNMFHSNSDYSINNHLNLKNFHTQLNRDYTYDTADNLLILSFFDKLKTRKRKVYKVKENHYIDILYEGSSSPKKNKNIPKKEKPKYDHRFLLKSNTDLEAYLKRKENNLNIKKVSFKADENKEEIYKSNNEENKTFERNEKILKIFNNRRNYYKRRKSVEKKIPSILNQTELSIITEENKNPKSSTNLPNIKNQKDIFTDKNIRNKRKIKENNFINDSDSKNDITISSDRNTKKENKTLIITKNKDSIKMELLKKNIIKITSLNKEKPLSKEKESKPQSNLSKKEMSKTVNAKFFKEKISSLKIKLNENERIKYLNRLNKQKFNKVISEFNEKEKKIERKYNKINKLITDLKNKEKKIKSADKEKSPKKSQKLIETKKPSSPKKTPRLLYKEWNEATSLYHFPLINKVIYKNKNNFDEIDRIKSNLRNEYTNKIKRNRIEYTRKIDGKKIIKKLNDKYELERLREYSEELKEKQRQKENFEYVEI